MLRLCTIAMILCGGIAHATDLTGTWGFTHANDQFQGWVVLRQSGEVLQGTWHTSRGKDEPDDAVSGRVDGNTLTLWRFIGNDKQVFVLTLSEDGNRLDGFGDGYFLRHTNLNMLRSAASPASPPATVFKDTAAPTADLSGLWTFTHFKIASKARSRCAARDLILPAYGTPARERMSRTIQYLAG
jgi:hypothetical protein